MVNTVVGETALALLRDLLPDTQLADGVLRRASKVRTSQHEPIEDLPFNRQGSWSGRVDGVIAGGDAWTGISGE